MAYHLLLWWLAGALFLALLGHMVYRWAGGSGDLEAPAAEAGGGGWTARLLGMLGRRLGGGDGYVLLRRRVRQAVVRRLALSLGLEEDVVREMVRRGEPVGPLRAGGDLAAFLRGGLPGRGGPEERLLYIIGLAEEL